jgi:hypothetical protein
MFHLNEYSCNKNQFNTKIHPTTKKYNQHTEICKEIIIQYDAYFTKCVMACARHRQGKDKGFTDDHKGMLIKGNCKNMHNGHGHGALWEKSNE